MKYAGEFILAIFLALSASYAQAESIPIDLRTFYADPTAIVSPDGFSATLTEDPVRDIILLSNDPVMGDPGIAIPSGLSALQFTYNFSEGGPYYFFATVFGVIPGSGSSIDTFYAKVFDGITGDILKDFLVEASGSGTVLWDLTGISSGTTILGLEFQLNSKDSIFSSFVDISDVELQYIPVPEPYTLVLLVCGLAGLVILRMKLAHKKYWVPNSGIYIQEMIF